MIGCWEANWIVGLSDGNAIATAQDRSTLGLNITQGTSDKRPTYKTNIQNSLPAMYLDGADHLINNDVAQYVSGADKTCTCIAVLKRGAASGEAYAIAFGGADNKPLIFPAAYSGDSIYAFRRDDSNTGFLKKLSVLGQTSAHIFSSVFSATTASTWFNGLLMHSAVAQDFGTATLTKFSVGAWLYGSTISQYLTGHVFEIWLFKSALTDAQRQWVEDKLAAKYAITLDRTAYFAASDFEDNGHSNAITRADGGTGAVRVSDGARVRYFTTATELYLESYNDIHTTYATMGDIGIRSNGADVGVVETTAVDSTKLATVSLSAGSKTVEIIASLQTSATRLGHFPIRVRWNAAASKVAATTSPRLIVYGDSITVGANSANPSLEGWVQLVRDAYAGSLLIEAFGQRSLNDDASDASARAAFVTYLSGLAPTALWLAIGANDGAKWTAANFGAAYADLLDKLHTAMPSLAIYAQTPILKTSDGSLGDYRAQIATAQSTRTAYCTLVDGTAILNGTTDLDDGVHPTTAGHAKYAAAVKTVLGL
jgi:lysophospholipase L1-like esterase